jgi:hypothetical protein
MTRCFIRSFLTREKNVYGKTITEPVLAATKALTKDPNKCLFTESKSEQQPNCTKELSHAFGF